jgi:hypothetical protein
MAQKSPSELLQHGTALRRFAPGIWSYVGAPLDPSGTNLKLPIDYTTEAEIDAGIEDGSLSVAAMGSDLSRSAVVASDGFAGRVHTPMSAGTVEASTQLPVGSQPTHDAGSVPATAQEAEEGAINAMREAGFDRTVPKSATEGAATKGKTSDEGSAFSKNDPKVAARQPHDDGRKHR